MLTFRSKSREITNVRLNNNAGLFGANFEKKNYTFADPGLQQRFANATTIYLCRFRSAYWFRSADGTDWKIPRMKEARKAALDKVWKKMLADLKVTLDAERVRERYAEED